MTVANTILLRESAPPERIRVPEAVASEIVRLRIATVTPLGEGDWLISAITKVGVVRIGSTELHIEPKVVLDHLFFLLSRTLNWDAWRDDTININSVDELYPAICSLFVMSAEKTISAGVLRSYEERRAAETSIRGRWLVSEQIRNRHGLPLPAELSYDDYTIDITENRLLRSAARRLLRFPSLEVALRRRLHKIDAQLMDANTLTPGLSLPQINFDRRNSYYRSAIGLGRLILEDASLDRGVGNVSASGFLLTMSTLFERFIEAEVTRSAAQYGGVVKPQKCDYLDRDEQIVVKPDLVWLHNGGVAAVFDAKYKAEKPAGYPNADIYQMLAYCLRHGLKEGHLIYAAGNEQPSEYVIIRTGVTIICHAILLDARPDEILAQIDRIVVRSDHGKSINVAQWQG